MAKEKPVANPLRPANRLLRGDNLKWVRDTKVFPDADFVSVRNIPR
ncbi:MAG: hypothetical protein ABSA97_06775 [Verrucomicrobiia bacterium]|jgi:hypothetical protein